MLTFIFGEVFDWGPGLVVAVEGGVGWQGVIEAVCRAPHTLLPQISHEELQANKCKDTEAEDREDHHVSELLHRLD